MSRITSKGQVTVPKNIREALGIKLGDDVDFEKKGEDIVLRKRIGASPFASYRGYLKKLKGKKIDALVKDLRGS